MSNSGSSDAIRNLAEGVRKFQREVYPQKKPLFDQLAQKQEPKILFITCSDSRVDPSLITQTEPGSLFLVQNAGNIVPAYSEVHDGVTASIEYAVTALGVEHVIICGHSGCGAMDALLDDAKLSQVAPSIRKWVSNAQATRAIMDAEGEFASKAEKLDRCVKINVQVQLDQLKTIPSVADKLAAGELTLHGWQYHIGTGEIEVLDTSSETFVPLAKAYAESGVVPTA